MGSVDSRHPHVAYSHLIGCEHWSGLRAAGLLLERGGGQPGILQPASVGMNDQACVGRMQKGMDRHWSLKTERLTLEAVWDH